MRIGIGYDAHRLVKGRKLILGGVLIPYEKGLAGHSDADVLVHAICDALFGGAGLDDIGYHFPDTDQAYKNIDSLLLLEKTNALIRKKGYAIVNIDTIVIAMAPKIAPHREAMRQKIAATLQMAPGSVNIKATTTEGLGEIGSGQGIAAHCVALLN